MSFYRLQIDRPFIGERVIDFRYQDALWVGDDPSNDVCIHSIDLPSRFKMLRKGFGVRHSPLRLRLTEEASVSLIGDVSKKKEWRNQLYSGAEYEITGQCEWKVGDVSFRLLPALKIPFSAESLPQADKDFSTWGKSVGYAAALHLLLFLFMFTYGLVSHFFSRRLPEEAQMTPVTIAQVKDVFKKPLPQLEKVESEALKEEIQEVIAPEKQMKATKTFKRPVKVAKGTISPGAASNLNSKGPLPAPKKNVNHMGLLAIQTTAGTSVVSVDAASSTKVASTAKRSGVQVAAVGMGSADFGVGTGGPADDSKIARLGSLSGSGYKGGALGGVSGSANGKRGPGIQLARKEIEIRGALDPNVIRQIIEERLSEIRYCYENALLKDAALSGKIATSWTIRADGSVADILSASDEIKGEILHPCVRNQIQKWKFPNPKGGGVVKVKYPFLFNPVGGT